MYEAHVYKDIPQHLIIRNECLKHISNIFMEV